MVRKSTDLLFIWLILLASSCVASTLPTQNPVAITQLSCGFSTAKSYKKGCILLSSERFKAFRKPTKNKNMWLLSPNKLFLIQHTHVHSCLLSEEKNDKDESSTEENVQYATSWMRLLSLHMSWR